MRARIAILTTVLALGTASAAVAQNQTCAVRTAIVDRLADKYGESRRSIGMASQGRVVEVFASHETGTWTITVTLPNGMTCMVASGQSFENLEETVPLGGVES